jgi:hypothetical protein
MIIAPPIKDATSESADGDLVNDLSIPLARLAREGSTLHLAEVGGDGNVLRANGAFARAAGGDPVGRPLASLLTPASNEQLASHVADGNPAALRIQLVPAGGERVTLHVFVSPMHSGYAVVGEPPWEDHRALEAQLMALNAELAVLSREHSRQARLLEKANRELQDSHWHLRKVSEVLPMCVSCREVKTGPDSWEDVATFLSRNGDFLSHGYCARCEAKLTLEIERGG